MCVFYFVLHNVLRSKVLDELSAVGMESETIVIIHADHGWHLGE